MIGAPVLGTKKLVVIEKDNEKNKTQKRDVTQASLIEMRS